MGRWGWALLAPILIGVLLTGAVIRRWSADAEPGREAAKVSPSPPPEIPDPDLRLDQAGWKRRFEETGGVEQVKVIEKASSVGSPGAAGFLAGIIEAEHRLAAAAARALGEVGKPEARPALLQTARSESILASSNAIRALGNIGETDDFPFLLEIAERTDGERRRHEAILALGNLRHPEAPGALAELLDKEEEEKVRLLALTALKSGKRRESIPTLERFLKRPVLTKKERVFAQAALRACKAE